MAKFKGFNESESLTPIPEPFFTRLLPEISDPAELKVILLALWRIAHLEGTARGLRLADFEPRELGLTADQVRSGLEHAVERGVLLTSGEGSLRVYYLNSPRGRAAAAAGAHVSGSMTAPIEQPNIFRLYEENIGPLTPLIADSLKAAEEDYAADWIAEAIQLAVTNNKRSWAYCEAILKRWKEEGRAEKQNRRDDKAARQRDVEEKIRRFIDG